MPWLTSGPRDTFVGTYASEYLRQKGTGKWDIKRAVSRACQASAHTIGKLGAQEAIPWLDEIDKLQVERPVTINAHDLEENHE
jgi:ribokinase